jgi:hypothetical protein
MMTFGAFDRLLHRFARGHAKLLEIMRHKLRRRKDARRDAVFFQQRNFERATRLCSISPQIAYSRPSIFPLWGGRSWRPKRLRRVRVRSVARVQNGRLHVRSDGRRRPVHRMADHQRVDLHRVHHARRVERRFPLVHRAERRIEIDDVRARRLAAISNDVRVRVEFSKNMLLTVFRRDDRSFCARAVLGGVLSRFSRIVAMSFVESCSMSSKCGGEMIGSSQESVGCYDLDYREHYVRVKLYLASGIRYSAF